MANHRKHQFDKELHSVVALHQKGARGTQTALRLTGRLDRLIRRVFQDVRQPDKNLVCAVALGAYGRKELCFCSDADIMVLVAGQEERTRTGGVMQEFLHRLLDTGLNIGHSFRTVEECLEFANGDFESWISLLETRFLCGNRKVYNGLVTALQVAIKNFDHKSFVIKLTDLFHARHAKYGNSTKLLEPNVKNSAGALRDAHTVLWMLRGTGTEKIPKTDFHNSPVLVSLFKSHVVRKLFAQSTLRKTQKALDFLLRARNEMHRQANSLHDTLEFAFQRHVAEGLRFHPTKDRTGVERFMQEYYGATRRISQLALRIVSWANDRWVQNPLTVPARHLDKRFVLRGSTLHSRPAFAHVNNESVLRALLFSCEYNAGFSPHLEDSIQRSLASLTPLKTERETSLFRQLLNQPSGVGEAFRQMNSLGVLARWIPEWKPMVAFFQHNQYHYYTADEHTLTVIANAEALADSESSFGEAFRSLPRKETLYLACLLHDIAKPVRIGSHEITGVGIAKTLLQRLHLAEISEDVLFLVRHHLMMEQVAFRRNLSDPQTIADFARKFSSRTRLDLLYVLTYADLSAVNKHVWTEWKDMLLFDLYKKTRSALDLQMTTEQIHRRSAEQSNAAAATLSQSLTEVLLPPEIESHQNLLENPSYIAAFTVNEIQAQLLALRNRKSVAVMFSHREDFTEVTVIANDAPFALSRFCGVLSANDANIFDANIFTRNDRIIIDKFRVLDFISKSMLSDSQCDKIQSEMSDVLEGRTDISDLLQRHRMKWKRRTIPVNPNVRVDVEFEDHPQYTIIDVFAADTLGFLYKITEAISKLDLNISFAKIATRMDGIVDSFYVLGLDGKRIDDPDRRKVIRSAILETIHELSESELALTP